MAHNDTYQCVGCHKVRKGRFGRRKEGAEGSWTQGDSQRKSIPFWYCFTCQPLGTLRGEEVDMPRKAEKVAHIEPNTAVGAVIDVSVQRQKGLQLVNPIVKELEGLTVSNAESYSLADTILGKIRNARKGWAPIWTHIQENVIKKQREALDALYAVNREVDGVLEKAEKDLKGKMATYKTEEARRLEEETRARDEEAARTQQLIEDTKAKLAAGASGSVKGVLTRSLNRLEDHQQAVMETAPLPALGVHSSSRQVTYIEVANLVLFAQALEKDPLKNSDIHKMILNAVNSVLKSEGRTSEAKTMMAEWPGLKLSNATQIVGH